MSLRFDTPYDTLSPLLRHTPLDISAAADAYAIAYKMMLPPC